MLNRASSKLSEHFPRVAQLVMPEVATDAASGASAAERVVTPNVRSVVVTSRSGSRSSPIGIPWTVPVCCLVAASALQTLTGSSSSRFLVPSTIARKNLIGARLFFLDSSFPIENTSKN